MIIIKDLKRLPDDATIASGEGFHGMQIEAGPLSTCDDDDFCPPDRALVAEVRPAYDAGRRLVDLAMTVHSNGKHHVYRRNGATSEQAVDMILEGLATL